MRAKIDINEVETRTKIRAKYLRAMENEEWDLLPGEVYVRSFLRTYGDFLGLDSRQLVDEFRRMYERPADHEPPPIAPPGRDQRGGRDRGTPGRRGIPPWAIIGAVIVAVVAVLYIVGTRGNGSHNASTSAHHTPAKHHHRLVHHKKHPAHHAPVKPKLVHLSLVPTGSVYVCLVNGAGRKLIPGQIYNTGQTIPVQTGAKLLLTLGNASITVKANGVPVPVTASSTSIGYQFTPSGHTALPASKQPSCT